MDTSFIQSVSMRDAMPEQRLTFVRHHHTKNYIRPSGRLERVQYNLYQCVCGTQKVLRRSSVTDKRPNSAWSCGCLRLENLQRILEKGLNRNGNGNGRKGKPSPNKGKVRIEVDGKIRFLKPKEADEILHKLYWSI
jgi:hypothetical protein